MDYGDVTLNTTFGGMGGLFSRSLFDITVEDGFKVNSAFDTSLNFAFGLASNKLNSSISNSGAPLFNSSFMGAYVEGISQMTVKTGLSMVKKKITEKTYTIQEGDTLGEIAKRYNRTVKGLSHQNKIADPNKIEAGATIKI